MFPFKKKISASKLITQKSVMSADEVHELHKLIKTDKGEMAKVKKHLKPFAEEALKNKHIEKMGTDELGMLQLIAKDVSVKNAKGDMHEVIWGAIINKLT